MPRSACWSGRWRVWSRARSMLPGRRRLVDLFTRCERLAVAGRGLAARRVESGLAWKRDGHRSAAHWLASTTGVSVGAATRSLQTARELEALPATAAAFRAGALSESQATRNCGDRDVGSLRWRARCWTSARSAGSFKGLRDRCRAASVRAADDAAAARRLHETRAVQCWTERDGAWRMDVRLAPDDGARLNAALTAKTDEVFRAARRRGASRTPGRVPCRRVDGAHHCRGPGEAHRSAPRRRFGCHPARLGRRRRTLRDRRDRTHPGHHRPRLAERRPHHDPGSSGRRGQSDLLTGSDHPRQAAPLAWNTPTRSVASRAARTSTASRSTMSSPSKTTDPPTRSTAGGSAPTTTNSRPTTTGTSTDPPAPAGCCAPDEPDP